MISLNLKKFVFIALIFNLLGSKDAFSYSYITINGETARWHESAHNFSLNPGSFGSTSNAYYQSFGQAINQWNAENGFIQFWNQLDACNSNLQPDDVVNTGIGDVGSIVSTIGAVLDGCNTVAFFNNSCQVPSVSITRLVAPMYWVSDGGGAFAQPGSNYGRILSHDTWFDAQCQWQPNIENSEHYSPGDIKSFLSASLHEIGHSLHLEYNTNAVSAMNFGRNFERLMADDIAGISYIYPSSVPSKTDLSVSTMKVSNGAMVMVNQTNVVNPDTQGVTQTTIEYTLQNLGTTAHYNVPVQFYLKNVADGSKRILDTTYFGLPARGWATYSRTLNIPDNVPSGEYKIWFKVDDNGQWNGGTPVSTVAENNENNNELPLPQSIFVQLSAINITGTLSDPMVFVGQNLTWDIQVCNASNAVVTNVLIYAAPFGPTATIGNQPTTISELQANQCQNLSFPIHVDGLTVTNVNNPFGWDMICSGISSYNSPSNLDYDLHGYCQSMHVIGMSNPGNVGVSTAGGTNPGGTVLPSKK